MGAVRRSPSAPVHEEFGFPVYSELEALLRETRPDALVVTSPNALHREHVLAGLAAGCHVLCDKPLGINADEVRAMQAAAEAANRVLMTGMNLRFQAHSAVAKDAVASRDFGRPLHAEAEWMRRRGVPGPGKWPTDKRVSGGGALIDAGIHVLDLAWWLLGRPEPVTVSAIWTHLFAGRLDSYSARKIWNGPLNPDGHMDVEDGCFLLVRLKNGASLSLRTSW